MTHAPQTIRLAIGLNMHDTFTLPTLVSALRRSTCQLCSHNGIEQPGTHIDMINLVSVSTVPRPGLATTLMSAQNSVWYCCSIA
jgi:hypothetical protein